MKTTIDKRDGEGLEKAAKAYLELLKDHIWKEDDILYPAGKKVLTTEDNEQLVADFEEIEEETGKGIHEKYALMVKELEKAAVRPLIYDLPVDVMNAMLDTLPLKSPL